ncbi:unnamed protein product [Ilex paraguariensis]|uniref:Uncharacterized protein n=1 Tax=Ilex paraguariensis TaxID=185542 RepID=A0ABC8SND9_9AQUA
MMDSAGASSRINDEKSLESGGHHHNHNNHFFHLVLRISLLFLAVVLACLVLYHSVYSFQFFPNSMYNPSASSQGSARGIISSLVSQLLVISFMGYTCTWVITDVFTLGLERFLHDRKLQCA